MKCELCKKAEAKLAVHLEHSDPPEELYVCQSCAAAVRQSQAEMESRRKLHATEGIEVGSRESMAFEILGSEREQAKEQVCAQCGMTREHYLMHGVFGCTTCYITFEAEVESFMEVFARSRKHRGKVPKRRGGGDGQIE